MHLLRFNLALALCLAPFAAAPAAPLTEAQVTKIINDVRVVDPAPDSAANRASRSGGNISLESRKTNGTAIDVSSSAQLLALLSTSAPGGSIKFTSAGGTIAGNSVTIFNGKIVTVKGPAPANVSTNHPNYTGSGGNGPTTGTFGGQGAVTQSLSAGPPGY